MDTLTHILIGASVGQIFSNKKNDYKPLIWGAIAGNIPDIDTVFQFFMSPADSMFFHRGLSHSILLYLVGAPLLALLINKIHKRNKYSYLDWLKISLAAWGSHLFLDLFNTYGTGLFEPFSHARISYDAVNVIDLLLWLFIFPAVVSMIFFKKTLGTKKILAASILMFSTGYILFSVFVKFHVESKAETQLISEDIVYKRVTSSPLPLSCLAWKIVVEDNDGYYSGIYYGFWKSKISFSHIPKNKQLRAEFQKYNDFRTLERFSNNWYNLIPQENGEIVFADLRFTSLDQTNSALSFPLRITGDSLEVRRTHPNRHVNYRNIVDLLEKISGKQSP